MPQAALVPLPAPMRGARAAFVFLTRIPVGGADYNEADWCWSTAWFPFVGLCLGGMLSLAWLALAPLAPLPRATFVVALGVYLTGAFHEDGLADTADALGGAYDRETLFAILKDSRIGTFGAAAVVLSLLGRVTLLAALGERAPLGLVLAGGLARLPPVWQLVTLRYVTAQGASKSGMLSRAGWGQALVASGWATAPLVAFPFGGWLSAWQSLSLVALLGLVGALTAWRYRTRAGGVTGDFLGATEQLGEIAVLALLSAF